MTMPSPTMNASTAKAHASDAVPTGALENDRRIVAHASYLADVRQARKLAKPKAVRMHCGADAPVNEDGPHTCG